MEKGLASGKYHPPDLERAKGLEMRCKVTRSNFTCLPDFPNVTHHTPAIATVVGEKHENRQRLDDVRCATRRRRAAGALVFQGGVHEQISFPAKQKRSPRCLRVSSMSQRTGARTKRSTPPTRVDSMDARNSSGQRFVISGENSVG